MKNWFTFLFSVLLATSISFAEDTAESTIEAPESVEAISEEVAVESVVVDDAVEVVEIEEVVEVSSAYLPVALVAFGDVDDALVIRAQKWAEHNLAIEVPVLPAQPTVQLGTFDEVAQNAELLMETNRLGLVVIWRPSSDVNNHGASFPDKRIAIANLNPMFTEGTEPEVIERRVERQVIRGICHVMGLEPSPNPMSAMFSYSNLQELDAIGRNLDLPWLQKLQNRLVEKGIRINPDSAYNVVQ